MLHKRSSSRRFLTYWFLGFVVLAATFVVSSSAQGNPLARSWPPVAGAAPNVTSSPTPTCLPSWALIGNPPESSGTLTLESIAAISPTDVWAVGHQLYGDWSRS